MGSLDFLQRYKEVKKKFWANPQKPTIVSRPPEELPPRTNDVVEKLPDVDPQNVSMKRMVKDPVYRESLRRQQILMGGITYRQLLLRGTDGLSKRIKLMILPVLEENNYSWEELFGTKSRFDELVKVKWEVFKILHEEGFTPTRIAKLCGMDHTSVLYGLGLLKKHENGKHKQSA